MLEDSPDSLLDCKVGGNECLGGYKHFLGKQDCTLLESWGCREGVVDYLEHFLENSFVQSYVDATYAQYLL